MRTKSSWPKYNDFEGHIGIDFLDKGEDQLLKLLQINPDEYYLLGIDFGIEEKLGVSSSFCVTALCLDSSRYPSHEQIIQELKKNNGVIDTEEFSIYVSFDEFFKVMKRFGGMIYRNGLASYISEIIKPDVDQLGS